MNAADLSITDIFLEKKEFSTKDLPAEMPQNIKEEISKELDGKKLTSLFFMHPSSDTGEDVALEFDEESVGTRLYPLSDYKPRKGEALQKGYL